MDHRSASLQFLSNTGLYPVKVRPRQKDPFPEWDPRTAAAQNHGLIIAELEHRKDLNFGALMFGKFIDIDVDGDSPFIGPALDHFLPRTPYIYGRASKPKSHRIYGLHDDFERGPYGPIMRFMKKLGKGEVDDYSYSVEIRGGKPENGLFSVLPGSIHPSGEEIQWATKLDPTVGGAFVEFGGLLRGLRLAIATSILAPYWVPGTRNDLSLALAGVLWRIRASTMGALNLHSDEEPPEDQYVLCLEDAEAIFRCLMELSGDEKNDERSRLLNLKNTWRKLDGESGAKVTGGKVLAELVGPGSGEKVVRALYRLLSDNEAAETVEKLAERYVMWYGPGVIIDLQMVINNRANPFMTREQALNSMGGKSVKIGDTKVPIAKLLFTSPIIHRVGGLTFDPSTDDVIVDVPHEGAMVNQWRGFSVKPTGQRTELDQVRAFHDYVVEVLADGDKNGAHWIFSWLADFIQFPAQKPGTALVLVGVEGAGKTFLGEHVLGRIIGPNHYGQTNSVTTLTHNFNTIIDNKIFVQCDEAVHSYQKDVASRLKSIITDEKFIVEPKGINAYYKPNHMRFLFTSNEEHAAIFVAPSRHERRFTIFKVSSKRAKDEEYWKMMRTWTPGALPSIMQWLKDYRYDRWVVMRPYETQAKLELQRTSFDVEVSWMLTRIAEGFPISDKTHNYWFEAYREAKLTGKEAERNMRKRDYWPDRILPHVLEDDFRAYVRARGKPVHSGSLMTTIRRVLPKNSMKALGQKTIRYIDLRTDQVTSDRIRLYDFPTVPEIVDHLKEKYGDIIEDGMKEASEEQEGVDGADMRGEV